MQELDPHLEEWLQDPFATFVLRALFRFLSGSAASVKRDQHQPAPAAAQSVRTSHAELNIYSLLIVRIIIIIILGAVSCA